MTPPSSYNDDTSPAALGRNAEHHHAFFRDSRRLTAFSASASAVLASLRPSAAFWISGQNASFSSASKGSGQLPVSLAVCAVWVRSTSAASGSVFSSAASPSLSATRLAVSTLRVLKKADAHLSLVMNLMKFQARSGFFEPLEMAKP